MAKMPMKGEPDMNRTEASYAAILFARKAIGEVKDYWYESVTVKLADGVRYTPDFAVLLADGTLELHEVKGGFIRDDARIKLRVAARHTPFTYVLAQYKNKASGWTIERVTN
jgi:hypothetical protein